MTSFTMPWGKEIQRSERLCAVEIAGQMQQVMGPKVLRVFGQLVLGEALRQVVERVRGDHEEKDAADQFKEAVQALENQSNVEGFVE